jgi:hypothetical protein
MKAVGGGKMEPVDYKPRKDIGTQRQAQEFSNHKRNVVVLK